MRKILILVLMVLAFTVRLQASDTQLVKGLEWEIQDETNIQFKMFNDTNLDRLYVIPNNPLFSSSSLTNGISFITEPKVAQALIELGVDIQSQTPFTPYTEKIGFTYYFNGASTIIQSQYTYLAIETENDTYYHKINLGIGQGLKIDFDLEYLLSEDGGVNTISDYVTTDFYINDVLFPYVTADLSDWSHARVYLFNPESVNESNFLIQGNYRYWYGFDTDTFKTGFYFTENYFIKYVQENIEPYDNGDSTLLDLLINDYVASIRANGITVTLPPNFALYVFSPAWYQDSIDPWYLITGTYSTINIRVPDLVYDGSEIWGNTLEYRLGGNVYTFNLKDNLGNTIPPIFGIRISKDFWSVTFNSNGGSAVDTLYVGANQVILSPVNPTRTGYEFLGWTRNSTINSVQPYNSIYAELNNFPLRQNFPVVFEGVCYDEDKDSCPSGIYVLEDVTYYGIWRKIPIVITLELNGGVRKTLPNFNNNLLITNYGDTANQNVYNVPVTDSVYRLGYGFLGWYIDEALTTPFNPNAPLTASLTVYAKWSPVTTGSTSPTVLNQVLDLLGLFNNAGMILIYFVILITIFISLCFIGVPDIVLAVVLIALTALWFSLGWLTPVASVLMVLFIIVVMILVFKWRT